MNAGRLRTVPNLLPEGSELRMIHGGSHIMMYEKNCYHDFQNSVVAFLEK